MLLLKDVRENWLLTYTRNFLFRLLFTGLSPNVVYGEKPLLSANTGKYHALF